MSNRKRYHSAYKSLFVAGILLPEQFAFIPRSTRSDWKKQNLSALIGAEYALFLENNIQLAVDRNKYRKLDVMCTAIHIVYITLTKVIQSVRSPKKLYRNNKELIINGIDKVEKKIGLRSALDFFQVSYQQYYTWKRNCPISPFGWCRKKQPLQLTSKEVRIMKEFYYTYGPKGWKLPSIHAAILRSGKAFFSLSTMYAYAHQLQLVSANGISRRKKYKKGIRAQRPLDIVHMDVTVFRTQDNVRCYLYFIQDNYSRAILGFKASLNLSAKTAYENLQEVYQKFLVHRNGVTDLITDDGPENKAQVRLFTNQQQNFRQLIAQKDILFSNSMVEGLNYRMKYDFLYVREILDFKHLQQQLPQMVHEYNYIKPHGVLCFLTPMEVLSGIIPNALRYQSELAMAKLTRIQENKTTKCNS